MDHLCCCLVFVCSLLVCLFIAALWSPAGKGLTSWLLFVKSYCDVVTFPGEVWYLIVLIPDLCHLSYFKPYDFTFWWAAWLRGYRKFCQGGPKLTYFFVFVFFSCWVEGGSIYHYKQSIIGLPAKCHLNGISLAGLMMAQHWMLAWQLCDFQGIRTSIA